MAAADVQDEVAGHDREPLPVRITLIPLAGTYVICRLGPDAPWPQWAGGGPFVSVTRTGDETSIVWPADAVPADVRCERGWRCLRVAGTLDFSAVGVLAGLVGPLAVAGVSVFVVSTFDTDYLFIRPPHFDRAIQALRGSGHIVGS